MLSKKMVLIAIGLIISFALGACMTIRTIRPPDLKESTLQHANQNNLTDLVKSGNFKEAFEKAFEEGNRLFETVFTAEEGVGANIGNGERFTRVPRADLNGPGQWAQHLPKRATGPNAQSCAQCHNLPADDGAGSIAANVHRDPEHSAMLSRFIQRNTPALFANGAMQRLAEEMSEELEAIREKAKAIACEYKKPVTISLVTKGVSFGSLKARPSKTSPCQAKVDTSKVEGIDPDLIVRPFQWKGSVAFLRDFIRGAAHNELGMQAVEIVGYGVDGDFDHVINELLYGDITAQTVYGAAQPRPTTKLELASLGLISELSLKEVESIKRGEKFFGQVKCDSCHKPSLKINNPIFSEPSQNPNYRDKTFPAGQDPRAVGVDPKFAIKFDLTKDQPDNQILDKDGNIIRLGSYKSDSDGRAIVELYSDLKRHDMGPELAESIDEIGSGRMGMNRLENKKTTGASVFRTPPLAGVASTGPYLHDGRATTLMEAIALHGGEANVSRDNFFALLVSQQEDIITFLKNLILFKNERER